MHVPVEVHDALNVLLVLIFTATHELLYKLPVVLVDGLGPNGATRDLALGLSHLRVHIVILKAVVFQRVAQTRRHAQSLSHIALERLAKDGFEAFLHLQVRHMNASVLLVALFLRTINKLFLERVTLVGTFDFRVLVLVISCLRLLFDVLRRPISHNLTVLQAVTTSIVTNADGVVDLVYALREVLHVGADLYLKLLLMLPVAIHKHWCQRLLFDVLFLVLAGSSTILLHLSAPDG